MSKQHPYGRHRLGFARSSAKRLTDSLFLAVCFLTALGGCAKSSEDNTPRPSEAAPTPTSPDTVLARIDDVVITVQDLQDQLNRQMPYVRRRYETLGAKRDFLENMVRFEILAKEATTRGFHKHPEVVRSMKQVMIKRLLKAQLGEQVKLESITEEEMLAYYAKHRAEFATPAQVRVAAIVAKNAANGKSIAKLALGEEGKTNKGFRELVIRYSTDEESKIRSGDLRYFTETTKEIPRQVVTAAFALAEIGDVAGPIATKAGFYVIKLTGKREALDRSFEQARRQIQNRIYQGRRLKAQESFVADLKKNAKVEINERNLSKIQIDKGAALPAPDQNTLPAMPQESENKGTGGTAGNSSKGK